MASRGSSPPLIRPSRMGVVERRNQSIVGMAHCMIKTKKLSGYFWGEAVSTVVHILNCSLTHAVDGKTLYEAWYREAPAVHYLHTFSCVAHVKIMHPGLKKLDDRNMKTVFIGYELGSKAYQCYDPISRCVVVSHDVVFDEAATWCWCDIDSEQQGTWEPFTVEYNTELVCDVFLAAPMPTPSPKPPPTGEHAAPVAEIDDDDLDAEHDDAPLRICPIDDIIGDVAPQALRARCLTSSSTSLL
jgi:hypothetical protein